jgi:ribulose-5-phosphate 4-epimerase/fuculose-1-phosphate aldolase
MSNENYLGIKFELKIISEDSPYHSLLPKLKKYCEAFHILNYAPDNEDGSAGNLSFRVAKASDAFIVTCSSTKLRPEMPDSDFAAVHKVELERNAVEAVCVRAPSSESLMHGALYRARPEINAIFHGHDDAIIRLASTTHIPETETEQAYGTPELVCEILQIPNNPNFIILKNHGFVALGKDMEDAARIIEDIRKKYL